MERAIASAGTESHVARLRQMASSTLADESILGIPAARGRVPEAIAERAKAAARGDTAQFLALTDAAHKDDWSKWLAAAHNAGLTDYETTLLDWDATGSNTAHVLERLRFRDGRVIISVVRQSWKQADGHWVVGPVSSPFKP